MQTKNVPNTTTTSKAARRLRIERERAAILHQRFTGLRNRPSKRAIKKRLALVAIALDGQPFRCAPDEFWRASLKTIVRAWYDWRKGGEVPGALLRRYGLSVRPSKLTSAQLRAFVVHLAKPGTRSTAAAFRNFCRRAKLPVSYSTLIRKLPPRAHRQLAAARRAIEAAELAFARARLTIEAHAANSIPPAPVRPPASLNFEI